MLVAIPGQYSGFVLEIRFCGCITVLSERLDGHCGGRPMGSSAICGHFAKVDFAELPLAQLVHEGEIFQGDSSQINRHRVDDGNVRGLLKNYFNTTFSFWSECTDF